MTHHIRLSAAAQKDVTEARDWYAEKPVPGLDLRFLEELENVFQQIDTFPKGFPVRHKDVRQANLHRFPYAVFYHMRKGEPYVLAVVHHARHPRVWMRRR